jgi:hypothetical protein
MNPERIGVVITASVAAVLVWRGLRWFFTGQAGPNPWDEETEARIQQADATPLCTRCLEPQDPGVKFCRNCGLPVDSLVPFSPYLYAFALGDVLATGTTRNFKVNWLTMTGYLLLSFASYAVFAPFYWFFLLRNVRRMNNPAWPPVFPPQPPPIPLSDGSLPAS